MSEYIDKNEAVGEGYLADWYIHSVAEYDDEKLNEPRWTEKHIEELTQDFIVIPKDTPAADVAPVVHGEWITIDDISRCSECGYIPAYDSAIDDLFYSPFCPSCGAKMDGGDNIMNTNPECFTPEGNNPYPLCTGKDMPECENCQLRAGWNGGDTDEDEG